MLSHPYPRPQRVSAGKSLFSRPPLFFVRSGIPQTTPEDHPKDSSVLSGKGTLSHQEGHALGELKVRFLLDALGNRAKGHSWHCRPPEVPGAQTDLPHSFHEK